VSARGALRTILGRYLGIGARHVRFAYGPHGKPTLTSLSATSFPHFNLSHADDVALIAVSLNRPLGVDIERVRPDIATRSEAARFLSSEERTVLASLPASVRVEAFFTCWTRKEAYVKARGCGLSLPLQDFDVSFDPGRPPLLLRTLPDSGDAARWSLHAVPAPRGYVAALAVQGVPSTIGYWKFPQPSWFG
jgi:4'-phosphopantetheinyl transferase